MPELVMGCQSHGMLREARKGALSRHPLLALLAVMMLRSFLALLRSTFPYLLRLFPRRSALSVLHLMLTHGLMKDMVCVLHRAP